MKNTALPFPSGHLPSQKRKWRATAWMTLVLLVLVVSIWLNFNPWLIFTEFEHVQALLADMLPPNFDFIFQKSSVQLSIWITLSMAFFGTVVGGGIALVLAFLAARNLNRPWVSALFKGLFAFERAIPSFVILLFCLILIGIGPFAGTLALVISTIGTFGRLFADSIEQVPAPQLNAMKATGARPFQVLRFAVLPQAGPGIIGNLFYAFDVNIRTAIGLGVFGGGGLGFDLNIAVGLMEYRSAVAIMIAIVAIIFVMDRISGYARSRWLDQKSLDKP